MSVSSSASIKKNQKAIMKEGVFKSLKKNIIKHPTLYLMALPVLLYYIIFKYIPMYGIVIAFERFVPAKGIFGSVWVGLDNFKMFFKDMYFSRIFFNTLILNLYDIVLGFPVPIIFALLLNEISSNKFKRLTQSITYMPHFVSAVVVCGIVAIFMRTDGVITSLWSSLTGNAPTNLLGIPGNFRMTYTLMNIWQQFGWGSIIFFAAMTNIDPSMYEAASIDGASRFRKVISITLPSITPTIVMLFILRIGRIMSLGFEKIILLYSPITYSTANVISSNTYRRGLIEMNYSFGAAVGLFNSVINMIMILLANYVSRKLNETSLW